MVALSDAERAMLDGERGPAVQKAMDLLVRYAEALGAEDFVETNNVAGVPGSSPKWVKEYYAADGGDYRRDESRAEGTVQGSAEHPARRHVAGELLDPPPRILNAAF